MKPICAVPILALRTPFDAKDAQSQGGACGPMRGRRVLPEGRRHGLYGWLLRCSSCDRMKESQLSGDAVLVAGDATSAAGDIVIPAFELQKLSYLHETLAPFPAQHRFRKVQLRPKCHSEDIHTPCTAERLPQIVWHP